MSFEGGEQSGGVARGPADHAIELLLETSPVPMWIYDAETLRFLCVNDATLERYGYTEAEFLGMRATDIRPFEDMVRLADGDQPRPGEVARSGPWRHITAGGRTLWVDVASRVVEWDGRDAVLVIASELPSEPTSAARSVPVLSHEAAFIRVVAERLDHARAIGAATAVVLVELAGVQRVHAVSGARDARALLDAAIASVEASCSPADTLALLGHTRVGVVCLAPTVTHLLGEAETVERNLRQPREPAEVRLADHSAFVGVGLVASGDPPTEADALVRDAGVALEEAMRAGHGHHLVVFDNRLRERITSEFSRDQAIRRALHAEDFSLHYQPIVDTESGAVHGYEALLRWRRPGGELEGPVEVIAVAEETGEIAALGSFVRRRALAECGAMLARAPDVFLCINLSPYELEHQGLAEEVEELCRQSGVAPAQLCFELTETALVTASDDFWRFQQLLDLKRIGVRLAIDDFGTGYSALSYLKKLPVDVVKIDRSFVADLATSEADTVLVEAITRLAHALGLSVVAEGVETETELQILKTLGVDRAQGFLLGRPAPPQDTSASLHPL